MLDIVSKKTARIVSEQGDRKSTHYVNLEGTSGFDLHRTSEACFLMSQERYCSQQVVVGTYDDSAQASRDYTDLTKAWESHRKGMSGEGRGIGRTSLAVALIGGLGMGAFGTTFFSRLPADFPPPQAAPAAWVPRASPAETPLAPSTPAANAAPRYAGPLPSANAPPASGAGAPNFGLEAN